MKQLIDRKYLLPVLFLAMLLLHGIDSQLDLIPEPPLQERRVPVAKPDLDIGFLDPFPGDYEAWYNDHFNWRNHFIRAGSYLNYHTFRQSALPAQAIIGKDGWLFKGGFQLDLVRGKVRFSPAQLETIRRELEYRQEVIAAEGGKFYFCIPPMKADLYPEVLPDHVKLLRSQSCARQLSDYLQANSNINYIDLLEPLQELKAKGSPLLFLKTDHHWTDYSGVLAAKVIVDDLRRDFPQLSPVDTGRVRFKTVTYKGLLLAEMLGLENEMSETLPLLDPEQAFQAKNGSRPYPIPAGFPFPEEYCMVKITDQAHLPKLMMVRESFANPLIKVLGDHFRESVFLFDNWKHQLHPDIVQQEKPDIYILMVWEGMLFNLLPNPPKEAQW